MKLFETEKGLLTSAKEIHSKLGISTKFANWIKYNLQRTELENGKDFALNLEQSTGGRPSTDYLLTRDSAITLIVISGGKKSKQLRDEVVQSYIKEQTGGSFSHQQVLEIHKMIKVFSVYEHRKLALTKNVENYVSNTLIIHPEYSKNTGLLYAKFHAWRNEVLKTGKDVLSQRVKEYCLIERKRIPARFTQDEALTLMGEYEQIKNAIWDLLCSQGKSEEMINNICALAQDLAKEMKPFLERLNESNLFFQKIDSNEVKGILELNQTTK
jgi:phage anti-repressor protein